MKLVIKKMRKLSFRFGIEPDSLIYLQNSHSWYGSKFNSSIVSCRFPSREAMFKMKKLSRFLENKKDKPISWNDVLDRKALFDESYAHEQAGDILRDNCKEISSVDINGGFIFGGPDGLKYTHLPTIEEREKEDLRSGWTRPIVIMSCKFKEGHNCSLMMRKDKADNIKGYQKTMKRLFLKNERKKWNENPSKKSKEITDKIDEILAEDLLG